MNDEQQTGSYEQIKKTASRIQQRIARCFVAMGRQSEAMRVLFYALDLDPGNLSARVDLERMMY
jgi:hypothetical protein